VNNLPQCGGVGRGKEGSATYFSLRQQPLVHRLICPPDFAAPEKRKKEAGHSLSDATYRRAAANPGSQSK